ncbi:MAG: Uma2 family endonuclease [Gemmataceae bacterium]|nr:Uma2 family endonuclease [Gemmataceae bacterium]
MTLIATVPPPAGRPPRDRILLSGVAWPTFVRMVRDLGGHRAARLTYDRGELEIMVPSFEHEADADALAEVVGALTRELGWPKVSGGSFTMRRRKWQKAIEPDRCYWIASAPGLVGVRQLDLKVHPPPDLGIEVDVTNSSLNRLAIYARLGVAEVWRLDGDDLRFHLLGAKRRYVESPTSRAFPFLTPADLMVFVRLGRHRKDLNVIAADAAAWFRRQVATPATPPPPPPAP